MRIETTSLCGLLIIHLDINIDARGSFREVWQDEAMRAAGLPQFQPVQYNVAESRQKVTRGIHQEPWEKYIHVVHGKVFAALVDLREESPSFGRYETIELDSSRALYLPRGLGNSYQVISEEAVYTYLVTAHWQQNLVYPAFSCFDPELNIPWPFPQEEAILSVKDQKNPLLSNLFSHRYK